MGTAAATQFFSKIYFIEKHLGIPVVPSFENIWHFENKAAQHYLFTLHKVQAPRTEVFFEYDSASAALKDEKFPLVFKSPQGAGSANVSLVGSYSNAARRLKHLFASQLWLKAKAKHGYAGAVAINIFSPWLWTHCLNRLVKRDPSQLAYWQEFIPGNDKDLRVTVIGDRFAVAFWRGNRAGDFRASGSGLLDYTTPVPEHIVKYCIQLNRRLKADSMAYDILFNGDSFYISEMSYGYLDKAVHNAAGYFYQPPGADALRFIERRVWPEELWVRWALIRSGRPITEDNDPASE